MPDPASEGPLFRQLTEVNNELVGTQRELARLNARYAESLEDLKIKEEVLSATLDGIPDFVFACDRAGRVTYANAAAIALSSGNEQRQVVGLPLSALIKIMDAQGNEVSLAEQLRQLPVRQLVLGPQDGFLLAREVGSDLPIAGSLGPVFGDTKSPIGSILTLRDSTSSLKSFQDSLGRSQRRAAESFAAGIAHQLNNLIMIILSNAQAVESSEGRSDLGTRLAGNIIRAGERASELVRRVVAASSFAADAQNAVDLNRIIRGIVTEFERNHPQIVFELRLAEPLSPVKGNETALIEAVRNVIENAVESLEVAGEISLETRDLNAPSSDGEGIEILIRDTGQGMSTEAVSRAFEPFFTTKFLGRGLGLAVAQGVIHGHGGEIAVTSEVGSGTTVAMTLPLSKQVL